MIANPKTEAEDQPVIRPVRAADSFGLLQMVRALAAHHDDDAKVGLDALTRDVLGPGRWMTVLVAEQAGKLVGYAALLPTAQLQHGARGVDLHHLYVSEGQRGTGLGADLLEAAQDESVRQGAVYMRVAAQVENIEAQGFYRKAGFQERSVQAVRFSKAL